MIPANMLLISFQIFDECVGERSPRGFDGSARTCDTEFHHEPFRQTR